MGSPAQSSDLMRPVDPRCSNHARFAKSFEVPPKGRHALFDPEVEAAADLPIHEGKPSQGGTCRTHGAPIITVNAGPKMKVTQTKMIKPKPKAAPHPSMPQGAEEIPIREDDQEDIFCQQKWKCRLSPPRSWLISSTTWRTVCFTWRTLWAGS